jgi:hypothetical protein
MGIKREACSLPDLGDAWEKNLLHKKMVRNGTFFD